MSIHPLDTEEGQCRLAELNAKIKRGERLTNDERAERQGIIFNHSGNASGFQVI